MKAKPAQARREVVGLLGIGLDGDDHQRITSVEHFFLVGGSEATHERMQDAAIRFNESLDRRGKRLADAEASEIADLLREAHE